MTELLTITLLVWNVHGLPLPWLTGGATPSKVRKAIKKIDHDILFAQEVWTNRMYKAVRKGSKPEAFSALHSDAGLAIVSDMQHTRYRQHKFENTTLSKMDWLSSKGFQTLYGPRNILFIQTHLDSGGDSMSAYVRLRQVTHIVSEASEHDGPIILVGDLNLKKGKAGRQFDEWVLARLKSDLGLELVIKTSSDYVLTRGVSTTRARRLNFGPSDHRPMLVTLEIK